MLAVMGPVLGVGNETRAEGFWEGLKKVFAPVEDVGKAGKKTVKAGKTLVTGEKSPGDMAEAARKCLPALEKFEKDPVGYQGGVTCLNKFDTPAKALAVIRGAENPPKPKPMPSAAEVKRMEAKAAAVFDVDQRVCRAIKAYDPRVACSITAMKACATALQRGGACGPVLSTALREDDFKVPFGGKKPQGPVKE